MPLNQPYLHKHNTTSTTLKNSPRGSNSRSSYHNRMLLLLPWLLLARRISGEAAGWRMDDGLFASVLDNDIFKDHNLYSSVSGDIYNSVNGDIYSSVSGDIYNSVNGPIYSSVNGQVKVDTDSPHQPPTSRPTKEEQTLAPGEIPQFVLDYAPYVHLYSEERYYPSDIGEFVKHFTVKFNNGTTVAGTENGKLNISQLGMLPKHHKLFLTAIDDFDTDPEWITGTNNMPSPINGEIKDAPATLIVVDKGNGWIDAFWFYFYAFNLGPFVMGAGPYGNHVGDWEHSLVRFYQGRPEVLWMSAHGGGGGYLFEAAEKFPGDDKHPVIFSARGTHANYVSVGKQQHDLPYGILCDFTDRGPLWNPAKNYLGYTYDGKRVYPATNNSNPSHVGRELEYGGWLTFNGHWGDKMIPASDPRQRHSFIGGYKYIDGPLGPLHKNLLRKSPCQRHKWWNFWNGCTIRERIKWGLGIEAEGYNCGAVFDVVRPRWVKAFLEKITWGGWFCLVMDMVYG